MRVLLVGVPGFHTQDEPLFPLGLGYLSSYLKELGHVVQSVYFVREEHRKKVLPEFIQGFVPEMVGFSCNTFNRGQVRRGIQQVKSLNPNIKVVVGGVHASYLYSQMLNDYGADYVVIGEGETTLAALCSCLESGGSLSSCNGIAFKNGSDITITHKREPIGNLDALPMPDYSFVENLIVSGNMGYTITSRGCPARCKFCSSGSYWGQNVRKHSVERSVDELIDIVSKYGVNRFHFHDNTFNFNIERVIEICTMILSRGLKISWGASCRVYPVNPEMIEAMVYAGCTHISWGVESGSQTIMDWMNKRITKDQIQYAYSLCEPYSKKGLLSTGTFMMVGFPGETERTVQESIDLLNSLSMTDRPSCSVLYVLPGTKIWEEQTAISEDYWVKTDDVLYSNKVVGIPMETLNQWGKAIEAAGKRIPFDNSKHFWDGVILGRIPEPKCPTFNEG